MRRRLAFILQGLIGFAVLHAQVPVRFSADVRTGETYIHPIGHGLYFVLEQSLDGGEWNFQIKPSPDSQEDYTACLRNPFWHEPLAVDLTAWRFSPDADAGWAEHMPAKEQFDFVTNAADQKYECAESSALYDTYELSQTKGKDPDYSGGLPHYKRRSVGHGYVIVTSVALKPGLTGEDAEFERVTLQVTVIFPNDKKVRRR
jgi:hypothetical protein